MADTAIAITAGAGTNVDTRTEATNGNHRQVVVVGDPSTNAGVAPVDATNGLSVTLTTAVPAGTNAIGKLAANSGVDIGDTDVTSVIPGTGATNLGKAVDSAAGGTDTGMAALAVRDDSLSTLTPADGDYAPLRVNSTGQLHVAATIDSSQLGSLGQAAASASAPVVMASDRQNSVAFAVAMTTDTGAYASGDLIADTQQLNGFFNKSDGKGVVNSITIIEKDAQGAAYYILFHQTSTSMGTENSAPNISDANLAAGLLGIVAVDTTDFVTVSGAKVATIKNIGLPVSAVSGTDDLYISILNSTGTPTYAGGTIDLIIGGLLD